MIVEREWIARRQKSCLREDSTFNTTKEIVIDFNARRSCCYNVRVNDLVQLHISLVRLARLMGGAPDPG